MPSFRFQWRKGLSKERTIWLGWWIQTQMYSMFKALFHSSRSMFTLFVACQQTTCRLTSVARAAPSWPRTNIQPLREKKKKWWCVVWLIQRKIKSRFSRRTPKSKQQWSEEETTCLLALIRATSELQTERAEVGVQRPKEGPRAMWQWSATEKSAFWSCGLGSLCQTELQWTF